VLLTVMIPTPVWGDKGLEEEKEKECTATLRTLMQWSR